MMTRKNALAARQMLMRIICLVTLGLVTLSGFGSSSVLADGNNTLAQSANFYLRGDVVSTGVGLRDTGIGDLTLTGIPSEASVFRAFLYWATLGSANTYNSVTLDGVGVSGELIGTTGDTCWSVQHNYVYRAEVTSLISGNGTYTIAGLPSSLTNGNDSQGATLVVVYSDPTAAYRTIIINDGAVALNEENSIYEDTISGYTPSDAPVDAQITYLVGDGQSIWVSGDVVVDGTTIATDVFNGTAGDFWDTLSFDISAFVDEPSVVTSVSNTDPGNPDSPDCLLWAGTIFSATAPPPNSSENQLALAENQLVHGDVTAAGVGLRGTGEGDIVITGIPAGAVVAEAYLYWATLGSSSEFNTIDFNGITVEGQHIATSADTCWGVSNNFVYRADVNAWVDGNGSYHIAGLPDNLYVSGNDSQGASLVLIYSGPYQDYLLRRVIIHDGAVTLDTVIHSYTDTINGFETNNPLTEARVTYIVGDGQSQWENGDVSFNGTSIASDIFNGVDGEHWGTLTFDVTNLVSTAPVSTTINNEGSGGDSPDCLLWAATLLSVTQPQPDYDEFVFLPFVHNSNLTP